MASDRPSEGGSLIIAALLLLVLGFTGYWIYEYARIGGPPWGLVPWFLLLAAAILLVGMFLVLRRGPRSR